MGDSDEEEMKEMRSSGRYGGSTRKPAADGGDDTMGLATGGGSSSSSGRRFAPPPRKKGALAEEDEDGPTYEVEEPAADMLGMGFLSFGKKEEVKTISMEVHDATIRNKGGLVLDKKGSIQFGRKVRDAAALAGASSRADKAEEEARVSAEVAKQREAATLAAEQSARRAALQDEEDDAQEEDEVPLPGKEREMLPVTHEVTLQAHEKCITAMGLDPKGVRMVVGGMGGECKFYDFQGMTEDKKPFREVEPVADHMVQAISWSNTGGCLLVVCSDSHARIYDRDGSAKPIQSTVKGDMYVRDMQHTKGHTQSLTGGMWHPFANEHWITSSLDGTIRIWDINAAPVGMDQVLPSVHVLKTMDRRNVCVGGASGRAGGLHPTCCVYSPSDAKLIVGGCSDGSIQVFFEKARYMKPDRILREAHTALVTDVAFIQKGTQSNLMVTRSRDHTMKVWDTRMLSDAKGPVKTWEDLPCGHEKSGLCISPCGQWIATGTAPEKASMGNSTVKIWETKDFKHVKTLDFGKKVPVKFAWPKELNQLIVGTSTGEVSMFYSPYASKRGALHFVGKKAKVKAEIDMGRSGPGPIFNMTDSEDIKKFYATGHGDMSKIRRAETRAAQKTITPIRPPDAKNTMAATSDSMAFAAMVMKSGAKILNLQNASGQEKDSQKALHKYADVDKNPDLVGHVYKDNPQPLDWSVDLSEGDKRMSAKMQGSFCRKCGQKVCRCIDYSVWGAKRKKTS